MNESISNRIYRSFLEAQLQPSAAAAGNNIKGASEGEQLQTSISKSVPSAQLIDRSANRTEPRNHSENYNVFPSPYTHFPSVTAKLKVEMFASLSEWEEYATAMGKHVIGLPKVHV